MRQKIDLDFYSLPAITKKSGARMTLESQILALESATVNIEVFRAMQGSTDTMRAIRGNM